MNKNKLFSMVVTGGLILTCSFSAFAQEANTSNKKTQPPANGVMRIHKGIGFGNNFAAWVEEGIISQEQADKWEAFNNAKIEERKAEMKKVKAMTEEERNAYFEENKGEKKDLLSEIIEEGIITQEQADGIKEKMPQRDINKGQKGFGNAISIWVEKGIITQDEADQWEAFNKTKAEARRAEKIQSMTEEEQKAYFEEQRADKKDFLREVVEEGIIIQEKADKIKAALDEMKQESGKTK